MKKKKLDKGFVRTTVKQYQLFKERCKHYVEHYELNGYDIAYMHVVNLKDKTATCNASLNGMSATIGFTDTWDGRVVPKLTDTAIDKIAHHEILHLLLWRLTNFIPRYESTSGKFDWLEFDKILAAEHEVINKIIKPNWWNI